MNISVDLSVGELCSEICRKLPPNVEIKLKANRVRVQHTGHHDNLSSAADIDRALNLNLVTVLKN